MNKKILFAAMMAFVSLRLYSRNFKQYNVSKHDYILSISVYDDKVVRRENVFWTRSENPNIYTDFKCSSQISSQSNSKPMRILNEKGVPLWKCSAEVTLSDHTKETFSEFACVMRDNCVPIPFIICDGVERHSNRDTVLSSRPVAIECIFPDETCAIRDAEGSGYKVQSVTVDGKEHKFPIKRKSNSYSFTVEEEGMHTIELECEDLIGNDYYIRYSLCVDMTPPVFSSIDVSTVDEWTREDVSVDLQIDDTLSGIDRYKGGYRLQNNENFTWFWMKNRRLVFNTEGISYLQFKAVDNVGNEIISDPVKIMIDKSFPEITILNVNNDRFTSSRYIEARGDDKYSGINDSSWEYVLDHGSHGKGRYVDGLSEGEHYVQFCVTDNVGYSTTCSFGFTCDFTKPEIKFKDLITKSNLIEPEITDLNLNKTSVKWSIDRKNWIQSPVAELPEGRFCISFYAEDYAGNNTTKTENMIIDHTPPELCFEIDEYVNSRNLQLNDFSCTDELSSQLSVQYNFDGRENENLDFAGKSTLEIPIFMLAEGKHILNMYGEDGHGNMSHVEKTFTIDKTIPVIDEINYESQGIKIDDGSYLKCVEDSDGKLDFSIDVAVDAHDQAGKETGKISLYKYSVNNSVYKTSGSAFFKIDEFIEGQNNLTFFAVDMAGNESEKKCVSFIRNSNHPSKPRVSSSTHKEAYSINDTVNSNECDFTIRNVYLNDNETEKNIWSIRKCRMIDGNPGRLEDALPMEEFSGICEESFPEVKIHINSLDDNEAGEFYCLAVSSVGLNGLKSDECKYVFRIDTSAPESFDACLLYQRDENRWYNDSDVIVKWIQGKDRTGIGRLEYKMNDSNWNIVEDLSENMLWVKDCGPGIISLKCCDLVGNYDEKNLCYKIDTNLPEFTEELFSAEWGDSVKGKSNDVLTLVFPQFIDLDSGPDCLKIKVKCLDKEITARDRFFYVDPSLTTWTVRNIDSDHNYSVEFTAIDNAGNEKIHKLIVPGKGNENVRSLGESIEKEFKSLVFQGDIEISCADGSSRLKENGMVYIGKEIQIWDGYENLEYLTVLPENCFFEDERFPSCVCKAKEGGTFLIKLWNLEFTCESISVDCERGITLNRVSYVQKHDSGTIDIKFEEINAGFPGRLKLNGSKTVIDEIDIDTGNVAFNGISAISFENNRKKMNGIITCVVNVPGKETEIEFETNECSLDFNDLSPFCCSSRVFSIMTENNTELTIVSSFVQNDRLYINEADLSVEFNNSQVVLKLYDFYIDIDSGVFFGDSLRKEIRDPNGEIKSFFDFYGLKVDADGLKFSSSGGFYATIDYESVYGLINIKNTVLNNKGLDLGKLENEELHFLLHGVEFCSLQYEFSIGIEGLYLNVGSGYFTFCKNRFEFNNLLLDMSEKDRVVRECEISYSRKLNTGYGCVLELKNLYIGKESVSCDIELPMSFSDDKISMSHVDLISSESMRWSSNEPLRLSINDVDVFVERSVFNGKTLTFEKGCIDLGGNNFYFHNDKILTCAFENIEFDYSEAIHEGNWQYENFICKFGSYDLEGFGFYLGNKGITFSSGFNKKFSSQNIEYSLNLFFTEIVICRSGISYCKKETNENGLKIHGHEIELKEYYLENDEKYGPCIKSVNAFVRIGSASECGKLQFGRICIYDNGVFNCEEYECHTEFTSSNGIKIITDRTKIDEKGILLDCDISVPQIEGFRKAESYDYILDKNHKIITYRKIDGFSWKYKGWKIESSEISIDENFSAESNNVNIGSCSLELGKICFSSDFRYFRPVKNFSNRIIEINNNDYFIQYSEFDSGELLCDVMVKLPDHLGSDYVFFKDVEFFPDGRCKSRNRMEYHEIESDLSYVKLKDMELVDDYISIGNVSYNFSSDEESFCFDVYDAKIFLSGTVQFENLYTSPVNFMGMYMKINSFTVDDEGFSFCGDLELPDDMPGLLGGKKIEFNELRCDRNGKIKSIDSLVQCNLSIPLSDKWSVEVASCGIRLDDESLPEIYFPECKLIFPPEYIVDYLLIENFSIGLMECDFRFNRIKCILEGKVSIAGILFELNEISISEDLVFGFGGRASFIGDDYPDFIKDRVASDVYLEIGRDGQISKLDVKVSGLNGFLENDICCVKLLDGTLEVIKEDDAYAAGISGQLCLEGDAALGFKSIIFNISEFKYDISGKRILSLKTDLSLDEVNFFDFRIEDFTAGIDWNCDSEKEIFLSGSVVFPDSLPDGLRGKRISLNRFVIDRSGAIRNFDFAYQHDSDVLCFDGIILHKPYMKAELSSKIPVIAIDSNISLSREKFPAGISDLNGRAMLKFSPNRIIDFKCDGFLDDRLIFNVIELNQGKFGFYLNDIGIPEFNIKGTLKFRKTSILPDEFNGLTTEIRNLTVASNGQIIDFDAGFNIAEVKFFNSLSLRNASVNFFTAEKNDLCLKLNGMLLLTGAHIPSEIKSAKFRIDSFTVSFSRGITGFYASLENDVNMTVLGGLRLNVQKLEISENGMSFGCRAWFDSNTFIDDFGFNVSEMCIGWDGKINRIKCGVDYTEFHFAGFRSSIRDLYFEKDDSCTDGFSIRMSQMKLVLPANCGNQSVDFNNACFKNGRLYGDIGCEKLTLSFCDFTLEMLKPVLNVENAKMEFSSVYLKCPSLLKNAELRIYGVSINSSSGINLHGIHFDLPDFKLGNGIGFRDVKAEFLIEGDSFFISAGGKVSIPNAGEIGAELSFTNRSPDYPIGLKRAFFSFEVAGFSKGIPLGNSGLYLTGVRGGLAYGIPGEVHASIRNYFENDGIRIQLGISVSDVSGGNIVRMTPDSWIDTKNLTWGCYGAITILSGTLNIKGDTSAILKRAGFSAELKFDLKVCCGKVSFAVFDTESGVKVSGHAKVDFIIPAGFIFEKKIKLFFKKITIRIPPSKIKLLSIGSDFGNFKNGFTGVTAYVSVFGYDLGLAASWGSLKAGNLNSYRLYDSKDYLTRSLPDEEYNDGFDSSMLNINSDQFSVGENMSRLSFVCAYVDCIPEISLIDPDGRVIEKGDENVDIIYFDDFYVFSINNPSQGKWKYKIENGIDGLYDISLFSLDKKPGISITKASYADEKIYIEGLSEKNTDIEICLSDENKIELYELAGIRTDEKGLFKASLDAINIFDGEYYVKAKTTDVHGLVYNNSYSDDVIKVEHKRKNLKEPENIRISEDERKDLYIKYDNPNGALTYGYYIELYNTKKDRVFVIDAGFINQYHLVEGNIGEEYEIRVCCYDKEKKPGKWSEKLHVNVGQQKKNINAPHIAERIIHVYAKPGEYLESIVNISSDGYSKTNTAYDYFVGKVITDNPEINISFDKESKWKDGFGKLRWFCHIHDYCSFGDYNIEALVANEGNLDLAESITFVVHVENPGISIESVIPSEINCSKDNYIFVTGTGFYENCRYFLEDMELCVVADDDSQNLRGKKLYIPKNDLSGDRELMIVSPSGDFAKKEIQLGHPELTIFPLKTEVDIRQGENAYIPVDVLRLFDCNDKIKLKKSQYDNFISVSVIETGNTSRYLLCLYASKNSIPGSSVLILEGNHGQKFEIKVNVVRKEVLVPEILAVEPKLCRLGDEIMIYGNNFKSDSIVLFDGEVVVPEYKSENLVSFKVNREFSIGTVAVKNNEDISNSEILHFRHDYLEIFSDVSLINISRGKEVKIPFEIRSSGKVEVSIFEDRDVPVEGKIKLINDEKGLYVLELKADEIASNGNWKIGLYARNENCITSREFTVEINDSPIIDCSGIYSGVVNESYFARLKTEETDVRPLFKCIDGKLPYGLKLSDDGLIYGTPEIPGIFVFQIECSVGEKAIAIEIIRIQIYEKEYLTKYCDPGNSNRIYGSMWESGHANPFMDEKMNKESIYLLGTCNCIVEVFDSGLSVFSPQGKKIWEKSFGTQLLEIRVSGDRVFALSSENILYSMNICNGVILRKWENVDFYSSNTDFLLVSQGGQVNKYYSKSCELIEKEVEYGGFISKDIIWKGNVMYFWDDRQLRRLGNGECKKLTLSGKIHSCITDNEYIYAFTENGVFKLSEDLEILFFKEIDIKDYVCSSIGKKLAFVNGKNLMVMDKSNLIDVHIIGINHPCRSMKQFDDGIAIYLENNIYKFEFSDMDGEV